jgi:hypothetical protein
MTAAPRLSRLIPSNSLANGHLGHNRLTDRILAPGQTRHQ